MNKDLKDNHKSDVSIDTLCGTVIEMANRWLAFLKIGI